MKVELTQEQYWQLFEKLPNELKEAVLSEETAINIYDICQRNEVNDMVSEIAKHVGQVLIGALPPSNFQEMLEKELKLKREVAKKIAQEINRFIFYPVKPCLEELYGIEIAAPSGAVKDSPPEKKKPSISKTEEKSSTEEPPAPETTDKYRESIE